MEKLEEPSTGGDEEGKIKKELLTRTDGFETSPDYGDAISTFVADTTTGGSRNHNKNQAPVIAIKTVKEADKITVCEFDYTQTLVSEEKMSKSVKKRQVIVDVEKIPHRLAENNDTLA